MKCLHIPVPNNTQGSAITNISFVKLSKHEYAGDSVPLQGSLHSGIPLFTGTCGEPCNYWDYHFLQLWIITRIEPSICFYTRHTTSTPQSGLLINIRLDATQTLHRNKQFCCLELLWVELYGTPRADIPEWIGSNRLRIQDKIQDNIQDKMYKILNIKTNYVRNCVKLCYFLYS